MSEISWKPSDGSISAEQAIALLNGKQSGHGFSQLARDRAISELIKSQMLEIHRAKTDGIPLPSGATLSPVPTVGALIAALSDFPRMAEIQGYKGKTKNLGNILRHYHVINLPFEDENDPNDDAYDISRGAVSRRNSRQFLLIRKQNPLAPGGSHEG